MGKKGRAQAGRKINDWAILLIDGKSRFDANRRAIVEVCDDVSIITVCSEVSAIDVLRTIAVDVIYNFPASDKREDAEKLRAYVATQHPRIRVVDPWTLPSRQKGSHGKPVPPLFLDESYDCEARKRAARDRMIADGSCTPGLRIDSEDVKKTKSRSTLNDKYAA